MKKNTFFEKTAAPEPIHLMTEVTSILDSICKVEYKGKKHNDKPDKTHNKGHPRSVLLSADALKRKEKSFRTDSALTVRT